MICIICNDEQPASEEHIIPKAMGNKNFVTTRVCEQCNNKLGGYVDNYFTDHILIKLIRKERNWLGESGKSIKVFPDKAKDENTGRLFLFRNDEIVLPPDVKIDGNIIRVEASTEEEAIKTARKKLQRMKLSEEMIQEIIHNRDTSEKMQLITPEFKIPADIDKGRFLLAVVKMAYEYVHLKLGDAYLENRTARDFRQELFKAIQVEYNRDVVLNYNFIMHHAQIAQNGIKELLNYIVPLNRRMSVPIRHLIVLHNTCDNQLVCDIFLGMIDIISFSVLVADECPSYYPHGKVFISIIFDNDDVIDL